MGVLILLVYLYFIAMFILGIIQLIEFLIYLFYLKTYEFGAITRRLKVHGIGLCIYFIGLYFLSQLNLAAMPILLYVFGLPWIFIVSWFNIKKISKKKYTIEHIIDDALIN